jgi:type IV pilus assembly protein PilA
MFEKIRKLKDRKGFTLVELIVVLVILAILAALLIPALTGYIDKANKEKIVSECRMVVMAAQTEASELYGKMDGGKLAFDDKTNTAANYDAAVKKLSETKGKFEIVLYDDGTVHTVKYWNSGWTVTYTDGTYNKAEAATTPDKDTTTKIEQKPKES